ncbi:MAG: XF1762 family protein [Longimicrobiales bacterium]
MSLEVVPCSVSDARVFVDRHHRHAPAPVGGLWAMAAAEDGEVVGVAIVGRPVSRVLDDGWTAEVTRLCTDGTRNAPSFLLGACRRAARELGYRRLVTYTLEEEGGASLRGAGYRRVHTVRARSWDTPSRPRVDKHPLQTRIRWEGLDEDTPDSHPLRDAPES